MGLGRIYFAKALDAVIIKGKEMIITCDSEKELHSLRVMIYKERDLYRRTVDKEVLMKLAFTRVMIDGRPCLKAHNPNRVPGTIKTFTIEGEELIPTEESKVATDIERLIQVMRQDGIPEEEIEQHIAVLNG